MTLYTTKITAQNYDIMKSKAKSAEILHLTVELCVVLPQNHAAILLIVENYHRSLMVKENGNTIWQQSCTPGLKHS